ncbi:MAG: hypothetical protein ABIR67_06180 [Gaiellaceae bacterium]
MLRERGLSRTPTRLLVLAGLAAVAVVLVGVLVVLRFTGDDERLSWAPPELVSPREVRVTKANLGELVSLEPGRDYRLILPEAPIESTLNVIGGRNVVLIGGEVRISGEVADAGVDRRYGIFLKDQTGTVHVEGLRIHGDDLAAGVVLDQAKGATVQLQNLRIEDVHARDNVEFTDAHPDVIQTWRGPHILRIDRLTGTTAAVGLQFQPYEYEWQQLGTWEVRRTNLRGSRSPDLSRHLLWRNTGVPGPAGSDTWWQQRNEDLWVEPAPGRAGWVAFPSAELWQPFRIGAPPGGDFVPKEAVGSSYASPGYRSSE